MPIKAVLDTNVLVSGLLSKQGPPHQVLDAWLEGYYALVTSLYLVDELIHVLSYPRIADRSRLAEREITNILAALLSQAEVTPGQIHLPGVTRDPKDDAVVACAVEGEADYIISGDQDLLVLGECQGCQVVAPRQFLDILNSSRERSASSRTGSLI
jgi:hypothetical protein